MRGQVLQAGGTDGGTIAGADGKRYSFTAADWKGTSPPEAGEQVDFVAGEGAALDIFPLPAGVAGPQVSPPGGGHAAGSSAASAGSAAGASAGYATAPPRPAASSEGSSVALGIIGILCLLLGFIIPVLPTIIAFVVGLVGADSAKRHNNDTGVILSRISWIGALILLGLMVVAIVLIATFAWPLLDVIWQIFLHLYNEAQETTQALALR